MRTQIQSVFNNFMIETKSSFYYAQILTICTDEVIVDMTRVF